MRLTISYPLSVLLLVANVNVDILPHRFYDPKQNEAQYKRQWSDSIPLEMGENILLYKGDLLLAGSVVVLVDRTYMVVRSELQALIAKRLGIASEDEIAGLGVRNNDQELEKPVWSPWPLFGEGLVRFRAIGIRVDKPREHAIKTKKYNQVEKINGYSELELRIIDAEPLFGKKCTLLILKRMDHSKEWMRERHTGIPIPFKAEAETVLITSTEIELVESFRKEKGDLKVRYFVPHPSYMEKQYWIEFMTSIKEAVKDF